MENLKLFEEFMGISKPKTENVKFVSRLLRAYYDKKIQIKSVGNTTYAQDPEDQYMGMDKITISYATNFEGKNVKININCDNYMTARDAEMLVDNQKMGLTPKEESWIIKNIGKKTKKVETDWTEDQIRGQERQKQMVQSSNAKAQQWRKDHPKEAAQRDARVKAGTEDIGGEENWGY